MKRNNSIRKSFNYTDKDFDKCGWLRKQGGAFKTMKRRYFVLVKNVLYYFTNQTKTTLKGQINLRNLELSELEEEKSSGDYTFSILPEQGQDTVNGAHERYQMSCNDRREAESWMQHIKQNMYLRRGGGLFGTSLKIVEKFLVKEYCYVPRVVFECCQRIRAIGMDEEGIFRKNGQQSLVYQMKSNVDRAKYNWDGVDIHTICSLLKLYLRELPEPLIPFCDYDSLKAIGYRIDVGEDLDLVRSKLNVLPLPNLQLLKYLCEFLLEVSNHRRNRMEILSLAKVFAPNILRDEDTDPYIEESTSCVICVTVAAFIKSHSQLFVCEYESLEKGDEDDIRDHDTYSVVSAFSNMSLAAAFMTFEDINGSTISLPQDYNNTERASSITFPTYNSNNNLSVSATFTHPRDRTKFEESQSTKRYTTANCNNDKQENYKTNNGKTTNVCEKCRDLEHQLTTVTNEREKLQEKYDAQRQICMRLENDVEFLRMELTESIRLRAENNNDLSDILAAFDIER